MTHADIRAFYTAIGEIITARCAELHMSDQELAVAVGVPTASIAKMQAGTQDFPAHRLIELANALGVRSTDMLPPHEPPADVLKHRNVLREVHSDEEARAMIRILRAWRQQHRAEDAT